LSLGFAPARAALRTGCWESRTTVNLPAMLGRAWRLPGGSSPLPPTRAFFGLGTGGRLGLLIDDKSVRGAPWLGPGGNWRRTLPIWPPTPDLLLSQNPNRPAANIRASSWGSLADRGSITGARWKTAAPRCADHFPGFLGTETKWRRLSPRHVTDAPWGCLARSDYCNRSSIWNSSCRGKSSGVRPRAVISRVSDGPFPAPLSLHEPHYHRTQPLGNRARGSIGRRGGARGGRPLRRQKP